MVTTTAHKSIARKQIRESTLLVLLLLALLTGSFIRISLFFTYPLVALLVLMQFRLKLMLGAGILFGLVLLSFLLSFLNGSYLLYKAMSLYHMVPFLLLLFSIPTKKSLQEDNLLKRFIALLSIIAVVNDVVGLWQFIDHPSDDSFIGIYSHYSLSLYGLMVLNTVLFAYYFSAFQYSKHKGQLFLSLIFLLSAVMGFYGAGLVAFLLAFIIAFLRLGVFAILRAVLISVVSFLLLYYLTLWLRPQAENYYAVSASRLTNFGKANAPRKILSFYNYASAYPSNIKDFVFGSGPGTFNSRSAFMVGSPSYFTQFGFIKSKEQPFYFKNYIYPLWNDTNTSQALFQDGFRNQPFSSLLAFLGEYGLLFTVIFGIAVIGYYQRVIKTIATNEGPPGELKWLFRFLLVFLLGLLFIDNYLEYPEVMLLITILLKLVHIEIEKKSIRHA